jgi:hypothetical protein
MQSGKFGWHKLKVYGTFLKPSILDLRPGSLTGPGISARQKIKTNSNFIIENKNVEMD